MIAKNRTAVQLFPDSVEPDDKSTVALVIEDGIPIPPIRPKGKNVGRRIYWPFAEMAIGQSILVPDWADEKRAMASLCKMRREKRIPKTWVFVMRKMNGRIRIWRDSDVQ
jgi:hypothetical protein